MNPVLALIITNVIWGAASPIFKYALINIPPFTLAFIRFFGAAVLFLPWGIKHWHKISGRDWFMLLLGAFFGISVNISFFFLGIQKTESINAPIIASSQPIFLYIFSILFLKERPRKKVITGILLSFIGVLIIVLSPIIVSGGLFSIKSDTLMLGNFFLVIATFGAVGNVIVYKNVLKKIDHYQVSLISFIFGGLSFLPMMLGELRHWSFGQLDIHGYVGIIFGVIFSSFIAYGLFNYGISKIKGQEVGVFSYIDPVVAVILAAPLVNEHPDMFFYIGSVLVFGGILIAEGRIHYHPLHRIKKYIVPQNNNDRR
ncbi:EamA family transporter [Candidatus Roizmanbacteria bacterium]|nr:EamA family transporter [Candidatus Roizmanbacteria bacterium]